MGKENPAWSSLGVCVIFVIIVVVVVKFLRRSLMIFIIKGFRTIVFIFIVISTYALRPSSGRTREPSRNFELRPLWNPRGSSVLIPFAITGYKC